MNFISTNLQIKDMIVSTNILETVNIYNNLKIPILLYTDDTVELIKPNKLIATIYFNKLTTIKFRLPKILNKKKNGLYQR